MKKITIILILCIIFFGCTADKKELKTDTHNLEEKVNVEEPVPETTEENVEEVELSSNFIFEYIDTDRDERIEKSVNKAFRKFLEDFELSYDEEIKFIIYKDQPSFWGGAFGGENNGMTTGFADQEARIVHITAPSDTSLRSEADMLKLPVHELVHIILPHGYIDIREGIACYLAGQITDFSPDDIPSNLSSIINYENLDVGLHRLRMQYNFAGYKTKFMIEECLDMDFVKYKSFMDNPDDYSIAGYKSETEFLADFRKYLVGIAEQT